MSSCRVDGYNPKVRAAVRETESKRRRGRAVAKMGDDAVPRLFAPHAPLPKNHGYGNQHRNAAEAKWRAAQQEKQKRAVAKQLGLELPAANPKKRAHDPEQPLAEWAMPTVPQAESDELVRGVSLTLTLTLTLALPQP